LKIFSSTACFEPSSWRLLALRAGDSRHVGFLVVVAAFARFAPASRCAPATGRILDFKRKRGRFYLLLFFVYQGALGRTGRQLKAVVQHAQAIKAAKWMITPIMTRAQEA